LKAFDWDGKQLTPSFEIDFRAQKLGRPHIMNLGQKSLYKPVTKPAGEAG
jgi:selenium-binding protein 1